MGNKKQEDLNARKFGHTDSSKTFRYSYNADEEAFDVISLGAAMIPRQFNRQELTNDANHNTTSISFYSDNTVEKSRVETIADVAGNLAGTYFVFYSGRDRVKYYVWYKVSGVGADPAVANATGIRVNLLNNDLAPVVALATKNAIDAAAEFYFRTLVVDSSNRLEITNKHGGATTDTVDGDTGFTFTTEQDGASELVGIIDITYDADYDITDMTGY